MITSNGFYVEKKESIKWFLGIYIYIYIYDSLLVFSFKLG